MNVKTTWKDYGVCLQRFKDTMLPEGWEYTLDAGGKWFTPGRETDEETLLDVRKKWYSYYRGFSEALAYERRNKG